MSDLSALPSEALWTNGVIDAIAVPAALHTGERLVTANEALCRLSGRSLPELQALPYDELVIVDDREVLRQACRHCLDLEKLPPVLQVRLLTAAGGERQLEIHVRPVDLGGRRAVVMTCVDQTDILHVQSSLLGLSEMLRQIVDGAPIAKFVINQDHRVTHWNGACERLSGLQRGDLIGTRDAWRAFYDDERPLLADLIVDGDFDAGMLQHLYAGQARPSAVMPGALEAEAFFPRFGDGGAWLYFTAAPLRDAHGRVIGAIETLQDVTERRRAQEELERHRSELEQLVQQRSAELAVTARELERFVTSSPIGVAYSSGGVIQRVNAAMAAMFGYTEQQMTGMPGTHVYLSADDYTALGQLAGPLLSRGEPLRHEMWLRHADGHPIWVQMDAHVADRQDTRRGTWWMMQDRTDIRQAQEQIQARFAELRETNKRLEEAQNQLLQQDKMASIGQLAAGVAHEINNPVGFVSSHLNTLRQYVEGLLELSVAYETALAGPGEPHAAATLARKREEVELEYLREDLPQLLDECSDGLGRVKKIVQDLKDFSRVDQSDWQEADLNAGLESTLNVVRHEVKYKAEIVRELAPLPQVTCLAAQLNPVFMNLIVNAAHAIHERGTITLRSGSQDEWVWVEVEDTGCGMSEDIRRRIFEPFFTTKDVGKGTGLGLSLSFSIVQKHGGAIRVRSQPGVGSTFRVWVPIGGPESLPTGAMPPDSKGEPVA